MSKRQRIIRLIVSGSLLAAVVLVGVTIYQVETNQQKPKKMQESAEVEEEENTAEEPLRGNSTATVDEEPHHAVVDGEEEIPPSEETASSQVTAQTEITEEKKEEISETTEEASVIIPDVNFTEESMLDWPVKGTLLMDYSMDHTVYFPTLDLYKYNPALLLGAAVGEPVEAAANCKIVKIEESIETGITLTADLGNGYQTVYGQLKDVLVKENDVIAAGTVLGYISEPTRFYTEEGSNLYFAMTKDGKSLDPILYLP